MGKNGLRFTLAGAIASVRGTLPQVMLAMSKTPEEIGADRVRPEGWAEDTDSSGDEGKSQSSTRKAKTPKGKGSAVPSQGGEAMEMLQSMKVLLNHFGGAGKGGRDLLCQRYTPRSFSFLSRSSNSSLPQKCFL